MKTFGLFMIIWIASIILSLNAFKNITIEEMLKMVLATQLAFIIYKLIKEENKI